MLYQTTQENIYYLIIMKRRMNYIFYENIAICTGHLVL
jgi:hypothetical protein